MDEHSDTSMACDGRTAAIEVPEVVKEDSIHTG